GIYSALHRVYRNRMSGAVPDPGRPESPEVNVRLPRPLWFAIATATLIVIGVILRVGTPLYRQHVAIREIEQSHGTYKTRPRGPEWLRKVLGEERMKPFDTVVAVNLGGLPNADSLLQHLYGLPDLQVLELTNTDVTDAGMANIRQLTNLEKLWLTG